MIPEAVMADVAAMHRLWLPMVLKAEEYHSGPGLDNPDFELGKVGWFFYSTQGGGDIISIAPEPRGYYSSRLGNDSENLRRAYISQQATVPQGKSWLTFWYFVDSQEDYCPAYTLYDFLRIEINGYEMLTFPLCEDPENPNRVWLKRAVDLSIYQGMNVYLKIYFESDGTLPTDLYVDDFAFE